MRFRIGLISLVLSAALLSAAPQSTQRTKEQIEHLHQDAKAYIATLENPQRDAEQKPQEVIKALGIKEGEVIADIGAGAGYFTFRFARHVGDGGRVYAVDISPDMILYMNRHIREMKLKNVVTVLSAPDDPLLLDASIDRFFICNTYHHIEKRAQYLALMRKMLKPGGQVVIVDYQKTALPVGPPVEMKLAREDVMLEMTSNGFKLDQEHTFLPYQYFLIFAAK
jgi:arsenite methyltransferase